ncbi:unnamed protein product [Trichobilharzia regenti]|nr:unnamed protein product [Trichobilharzia regenti]
MCYLFQIPTNLTCELFKIIFFIFFLFKEYDFVFTVDIDESMPPLKLPYNRTEDPWFAAHSFIQRNDLPAGYLDTVANFIIQNAGPQVGSGVASDSSYCDPFTGAHRYIPQNPSADKTSVTNTTSSPPILCFPSETFIPIKAISLGPLMSKRNFRMCKFCFS